MSCFDHVVAASVDDVRCAEVTGMLQAGRLDVGHDDRMRARQPGAHHRREADAASADDQQRRTRNSTSHVQHRADSGDHRAPRDRRHRRRHPLRYPHHRHLGHHHVLGQARHPHQVMHRLAVESQPSRAIARQPTGLRLHPPTLTQHRLTGDAEPAHPTPRPPQQRHRIAGPHPLDARTDGLHPPGSFVADHHRQPTHEVTPHVVVVAVTHPGRRHPHQYLAGTRRLELDLLHPQRRTHLVQHRRSDELRTRRRHNTRPPSRTVGAGASAATVNSAPAPSALTV